MHCEVMVVTPTYCTEQNNRLALLLQSIYWVQRQTLKEHVHVIVDDGSTDESPEILDRIAFYNPRILVYHQTNRGSSSAVNHGVEKALNEFDPRYITISHSDDLLTPSSLSIRKELGDVKGTRMVYTDLMVFYENDSSPRRIRAIGFPNSSSLCEHLLDHGYIPYPTMFWERDFFVDRLGGYDERLTSAEDFDIALRSARELINSGFTHSSSHEITAAYRIHANQLGSQNIIDGTKWRCYRIIFGKYFMGGDYRIRLAKESLAILRALLPEGIKRHLRPVKRLLKREFFPHDQVRLSDTDIEFLRMAKTIDYPNLITPN